MEWTIDYMDRYRIFTTDPVKLSQRDKLRKFRWTPCMQTANTACKIVGPWCLRMPTTASSTTGLASGRVYVKAVRFFCSSISSTCGLGLA